MTKLDRYKREMKRLDAACKRLRKERHDFQVEAEKRAKFQAEEEIRIAHEITYGHREQLSAMVNERKALKAQLALKDLEVQYLNKAIERLMGR